MKGLKKTRRGAIALVIAMVLVSGLALTGCDNGFGPSRGFDPVGTWRGTHTDFWDGIHFRQENTLVLWANGTGMLRTDTFQNNILYYTSIYDLSYSVSGNIITVIPHITGLGPQQISGVFTDNNTLILHGIISITFRRQ